MPAVCCMHECHWLQGMTFSHRCRNWGEGEGEGGELGVALGAIYIYKRYGELYIGHILWVPPNLFMFLCSVSMACDTELFLL